MPSFRLQESNHARGRIFIALGANRPYRRAAPLENLNSALVALDDADVTVIATSRPWSSPAWPDPSDPPFINGCAELACDLPPDRLLEQLHHVERRLGRSRTVRNAPRTLDLDLIDYQGLVRAGDSEAEPTLPHPRAAQRAFVLLPLRDIAPNWRHPASGHSLEQLIAALPLADRQACRPAAGVLCAAANGLKRSLE